MRSQDLPPERDRNATLGSIAIHCCLLLMLAALPRAAAFPDDVTDERALLASRISLERLPPVPHVAPTARPHPAAVPGTPPPLLVAKANGKARRKLIVAAEQRYVTPGPAARHIAPRTRHAPAIPVLIALQTTSPLQTPAATVAATPVPTAAATPAPTAAPPQSTMGIGNLGDTWPARPMPGMVSTLRARINGHAVVRIDVDERGKPVSVTIVSGIDDPAVRSAILQMLNAATYIPARCNGLDCEETMTLTL